METIGQRLKRIRVDNKLNQDRFGELCGVSKGAVSQWEKDQTTPELSKLIQIRQRLIFSFDYLLTGAPDYAISKVPSQFAAKEPQPQHSRPLVQSVCDMAEKLDDAGLLKLQGYAACLLPEHSLIKAKQA